MKKNHMGLLFYLLLFSACATQPEINFNYKIGEPEIRMTEFLNTDGFAKYKMIEEFSFLTTPVATASLNKIASKQLLELGKEKKADLIYIKSKEVFPETSMLNMLQRQRITGILFKKIETN